MHGPVDAEVHELAVEACRGGRRLSRLLHGARAALKGCRTCQRKDRPGLTRKAPQSGLTMSSLLHVILLHVRTKSSKTAILQSTASKLASPATLLRIPVPELCKTASDIGTILETRRDVIGAALGRVRLLPGSTRSELARLVPSACFSPSAAMPRATMRQ